MRERITVSGFRAPRTRRWFWPRLPAGFVWPILPRHLLWVVPLAALPFVRWDWGTPYMLLTYTTAGPSNGTNCESAFYIGFNDTRSIHPRNGRCPYIRFIRPEEN